MSDESGALVPVRQETVIFYEDEIPVVFVVKRAGEQETFVPVRPVVDNLGLSWPGQYERLKRDAVLSKEIRSVRVSRTERGRFGEEDETVVTREMICLPLDFLNGWLFSINANRVKEEIRERLIRYQHECYQVLAEAAQEGRLTADDDFEMMLRQADPETVQAYQVARAVVRLARQQIVMEARFTGRLDEHERRLEDLESTLGDPDRLITPSQASQISQAVKAIAHELGKHSGKNEYGGIYGELYRRFEITSYKLLPAHRFDEAMEFLTEWYMSVAGRDDVPF